MTHPEEVLRAPISEDPFDRMLRSGRRPSAPWGRWLKEALASGERAEITQLLFNWKPSMVGVGSVVRDTLQIIAMFRSKLSDCFVSLTFYRAPSLFFLLGRESVSGGSVAWSQARSVAWLVGRSSVGGCFWVFACFFCMFGGCCGFGFCTKPKPSQSETNPNQTSAQATLSQLTPAKTTAKNRPQTGAKETPHTKPALNYPEATLHRSRPLNQHKGRNLKPTRKQTLKQA